MLQISAPSSCTAVSLSGGRCSSAKIQNADRPEQCYIHAAVHDPCRTDCQPSTGALHFPPEGIISFPASTSLSPYCCCSSQPTPLALCKLNTRLLQVLNRRLAAPKEELQTDLSAQIHCALSFAASTVRTAHRFWCSLNIQAREPKMRAGESHRAGSNLCICTGQQA